VDEIGHAGKGQSFNVVVYRHRFGALGVHELREPCGQDAQTAHTKVQLLRLAQPRITCAWTV
jgi:hypothetical protein